MKWSKQQIDAITTRNCNVLVSAAAGSGKTAVLIERILRRITEDQISVDQFLVLTFTNAAASEMKERLRTGLEEKMEISQSAFLKQQFRLLGKAKIKTLHSFCMDLLRKHFAVLALDPNFRLADESETLLLRKECMEESLEYFYTQGSDAFLALIEHFSKKIHDDHFLNAMASLYRFLMSIPHPKTWVKEFLDTLNLAKTSPFDNPFEKVITKDASLQLSFLKNEMEQAIHICKENEFHALELLQKEHGNVCKLFELSNVHPSRSFYQALSEFPSFERFSTRKKDQDEEIWSEMKNKRDLVKTSIEELKLSTLCENEITIVENIKQLKILYEAIFEYIFYFSDLYQSVKARKNIVDFHDLEQFTVRLLTNEDGSYSKYAHAIREEICEIYIDEYQDINSIQELILSSLSKDNNRFMVGDVKQSIYQFRQANPSIFLEKYKNYQGEAEKVIHLYQNFRSRPSILNGVNQIFSSIMTQESAGISYDEFAKLHYAGNYPDEGAPIQLLMEEYKGGNKKEQEAEMVSQKIQELIENHTQIWDRKQKKYRTILYKDIVILSRTIKNDDVRLMNTLSKQGIPCYSENKRGFYVSFEILTMTSYLKIIDNPLQDIPLLSVLQSSIYRFSLDDLAQIKQHQQSETWFYKIISDTTMPLETSLKEKISYFLTDLEYFRTLKNHVSVSELVEQLFSRTKIREICAMMDQPKIRQINLQILLQQAYDFEQTSMKNLFRFTRYIEMLEEVKFDAQEGKIQHEESNVVKIMSIHKSKGLEFPIVFLMHNDQQFNLQDLRKDLLTNEALGIGIDTIDWKQRIRYRNMIKESIQICVKNNSLAEEMRILYVALTRACEQLYISAVLKDCSSKNATWKNRSLNDNSAFHVCSRRNVLDWMMPVAFSHPQYFMKNEGKKETVLPTIVPTKTLMTEFSFPPSVYSYPYQALNQYPQYISVSEIKRRYLTKEEAKSNMPLPALLKNKHTNKTAAEIGIIYHEIMEKLDFRRIYNEKELHHSLQQLMDKQLFKKENLDHINTAQILAFFQTTLYQQILSSDWIEKERSFFTALVVEEGNKDDFVMLRGKIDCYFSHRNFLYLIDFKSDQLEHESLFLDKYRAQLQIYADVLEKHYGQTLKKAYIYSFHLGRTIYCPLQKQQKSLYFLS